MCAARDRLNHRDRIAWMHTSHVLMTLVNINRSRKKPYELVDFYPYELPGKKAVKKPAMSHKNFFDAVASQMEKNGKD
mgnify:FL=1